MSSAGKIADTSTVGASAPAAGTRNTGFVKVPTPSIVTLIQGVSSTITFVEEDLRSMVDSMCIAAERRVEGILGNSRRRRYGHAAMLVASCVVLAPAAGGKDLSAWMMGLRQTYSRRHAFREELRRAMESLGVRD